MPFRHAELVDRCDTCEAPSASRCRRCGRTSCAEHTFAERGLCTDCEASLYLQLEPVGRQVRILWRPLAAWAVVLGAVALASSFAAFVMLMATPYVLPIVGAAADALDRRQTTRRFIRELGGGGAAPRALPAGAGDGGDRPR